MRSNVPSHISWTKHKTKEELLDDPLAESLYGLFLKVKDSPRHIAISPENLINEAYYIVNQIYQEDNPKDCLNRYAHEIELDLGWKYAIDIVMPMVYVVLRVQKRIPKRIEEVVKQIEGIYHQNCYWDVFCGLANGKKPQKQKKKLMIPQMLESAINQCKQEFANVCGKEVYALNLTINLNNEIKDIEHLHLAHADVAVGVAEKGANVYHHKVIDNEKK